MVFKRLLERPSEETSEESTLKTVESLAMELEKIAELRRIVLEITEPTPVSHTTT